jgi:hypothetical protein
VADLADVATDPRTWSDLVAEPLCRALGMEPVPGALPDDFPDRVDRIERTVYRDPRWNAKR